MEKTLAELKFEIVKSGLALGEAYKKWTGMISKEQNPNLLSMSEGVEMEEARSFMIENQQTFLKELIELDYLRVKDEMNDTYVRGSNFGDEFFVAVANIFVEETGHITEYENNYDETAKALYELVTPKKRNAI